MSLLWNSGLITDYLFTEKTNSQQNKPYLLLIVLSNSFRQFFKRTDLKSKWKDLKRDYSQDIPWILKRKSRTKHLNQIIRNENISFHKVKKIGFNIFVDLVSLRTISIAFHNLENLANGKISRFLFKSRS